MSRGYSKPAKWCLLGSQHSDQELRIAAIHFVGTRHGHDTVCSGKGGRYGLRGALKLRRVLELEGGRPGAQLQAQRVKVEHQPLVLRRRASIQVSQEQVPLTSRSLYATGHVDNTFMATSDLVSLLTKQLSRLLESTILL